MSKIVTFDQAKRLQALGISIVSDCGYVGYTKSGELVSRRKFKEDRDYQLIPSWIRVFTLPEALDWIREEKGVACGVEPDYNTVKVGEYYAGGYGFNGHVVKVVYKYKYQYYDKNNELHSKKFDTHPLAESALLDSLLDYLEKTNNNIDQQS